MYDVSSMLAMLILTWSLCDVICHKFIMVEMAGSCLLRHLNFPCKLAQLLLKVFNVSSWEVIKLVSLQTKSWKLDLQLTVKILDFIKVSILWRPLTRLFQRCECELNLVMRDVKVDTGRCRCSRWSYPTPVRRASVDLSWSFSHLTKVWPKASPKLKTFLSKLITL